MKKTYEKPEMKAIEIKAEQSLLTASDPYGPQVENEEHDGEWD